MRRLFGLGVLLIAFSFSQLARAQTLPNPTSDDDMGMQPYQAYHGGDIDSVSLTSGTLNLNFPFLSYLQRGKLHFSFNLLYNNQFQHLGELVVTAGKTTVKTFIWGFPCATPTACPSELPVERSDAFVGAAQSFKVLGTGASLAVYGGTQLLYTDYYEDYSLQTADGSKHLLANLGTYSRVNLSPDYLYEGTGPWETLDATGWRVNGVFEASITSGTGAYVPTSVIGSDGVLYSTATAFEEDPNGNMITLNSGTYSDSLDRQIPAPPTALSASNTGTSLCPETPLPVDHAVLWSPPGPNGNTVNYTLCYAKVSINIAPGPGTTQQFPGVTDESFMKLQSIVLPNGQAWNFAYNDPGDGSTYDGYPVNYGTLTQVTLPTGGTISYTYQTAGSYTASCQTYGRWVATRAVNSNDGTGSHTWTYAYTVASSGVASATTVADPLGNYTVHTFGLGAGGCSVYETTTQYYQVGGTLLKTVTTAYDSSGSRNEGVGGGPANVVPAQITTAWANGQTAQVAKTYDAGYSYTDWLGGTGVTGIYGKVLTETDSDYGSGAPSSTILRTTTNTYQALGNSTYLTNNLLDLPASVTVTGGSAAAYTTYGYDETALVSSGISTQHDSSPPTGSARGNQTSTHRQLNNGSTTATTYCPAVSSGGYLVSNISYYDTGMPYVAADPCNLPTATYLYSLTYAGAFPTTITNAAGQPTLYTYDSNTGLLASKKDPNLQTTSYTYDNMWRLASVTYPDGGSAVITRQESTFPDTATLTKKITSSQNYITTNVFDGLGRVSQSQLTSDSPSTTYTFTEYDPLGRKGTVYNPTRCSPPTTNCNESTWGYAVYAYDGLSRIKQVTQPDGSILLTSYTGNSTTVTDEAGKKRTTFVDGLGRVFQVYEDPSNLNYETVYQYDALDDLTSVTQSSSRQRTFTYDSLKRLTNGSNPESGTVAYTYDADGNIITRLDARSTKTTYTYDQLNRVLSKTYTDSTPTVTYAYDGNTPVGCSTGVSNYGLAIGRRTAMCDAGSQGVESWTYNDPQNVGWQITDRRTTGSVTESITTQNNLMGSLATLTYPSGRIITYTDSGAERPVSAQDVANGITYASSGTYAPPGELNSLNQGTSVKVTNIFNSRLQPCWIYGTNATALPGSTLCTGSAVTGNIIDLKYNFAFGSADNGNVVSITNDRIPNRSQSFLYDNLNRITSATTTATHATDPTDCWGEAYLFDNQTIAGGAWGNLTTIGVASSAYIGCTQESLTQTALSNNQISGFCYDASGNLLAEASCPAGPPYPFNYNAENQLTSTSAGIAYTYDGDGNRVSKSNGKLYWYGGESDPIVETDASGNTTDEYIFFGGKRIARRDSAGNIVYYMADHLGTSRIVTNTSGSILDESDFYPFGGERVITASSGNTYKFTGKERDSESVLDNFGVRYGASSLGRFMSPDPFGGHLGDPQTLNKYVYVRDNPVSFTDPTGLDLKAICGNESSNCHKQHWWSRHRYVGTYDQAGHFNITHFQTDQNGNIAGHNINFNSSGVHVDGRQGEYIPNTPQTRVNGDPNSNFAGSHFEVNSNCLGTCLAGGALYADNGKASIFVGVVASMEGPNVGLDRYGDHPGDQYRGKNENGPDAHLSYITDQTGVPENGLPFHIDNRNPYHSVGGFLQHTLDLVEYDFKADVLRQQGPPLPDDTGNTP